MKIACFGNLNANLPALEAVLADAKRRDVDLFLHVGNLIGGGSAVNETLTRLKQEKFVSILGPEDSRILKFKQKKTKVGTSHHPDKWLALKARYDALSDEGRGILQSMPPKLRLRLELKNVLLLKESPFLRPGTTPEEPHPENDTFLKQPKSDIIIWTGGNGPAAWKKELVWLVNTGNLVHEADPAKARYTILQWKPGFFQVRHYTISYHPGDVPGSEAVHPKNPFQPNQTPYPVNTPPDSSPDESISVNTDTTKVTPFNAEDALPAVFRLMQSCLGQGEAPSEAPNEAPNEALTHSNQVTRLALHLFDRLQPLHEYGEPERFLLQCAALLHDIGWITGPEGHHKTAFNIITNTGILPFLKRDRFIIGAVARYHRKSTPRPHHLYFATMAPSDRRLVTILAAILRTADGLDRSHRTLVGEFNCQVSPEEVRLICDAAAPEDGEIQTVLRKGTLLEQTFGRKLVVEWNLTPQVLPT